MRVQQFFNPEIQTVKPVDLEVPTESKTKTWLQLDSMIDYLHVYRQSFKGSREPVWERHAMARQKSKKFVTQEEPTDRRKTVKEYISQVKTADSNRPDYLLTQR